MGVLEAQLNQRSLYTVLFDKGFKVDAGTGSGIAVKRKLPVAKDLFLGKLKRLS
jgi:hypothetical protein